MPDGQRSARVCVARIGAAHGLRGEVRLNTFTADPLAVTRYGVLESQDGARSLEIDACRPGKGFLVVRFKGVADRTAAERLRNIEQYVPRDRLPAPEPGEFYHADLIGLRAVTPDGGEIGTVVAVQNFGAGDLLEIKPAAGGMTLLLPFTDATVPSVDLASGSLVVVRPEVMPDPDDPQPSS